MADMTAARQALRTAVEAMAAAPDRLITSQINSDQTWGTAASPEVTVIDTAATNAFHNPFGTTGLTMTGNGTLIIKGWFNVQQVIINWTGDVYVLGYNSDQNTTHVVSAKALRATIDGNLVMVADDSTRAEMHLSPENGIESDITVNGSLLMFGVSDRLTDASSRGATSILLNGARLEVNGVLGMSGWASYLELKPNSSGVIPQMTVNGVFDVSLSDGHYDSPDFQWKMDGDFSLYRDEILAGQAALSLSAEELALLPGISAGGGGSSAPTYTVSSGSSLGKGGKTTLDEMDAIIYGTQGSDFGVQ